MPGEGESSLTEVLLSRLSPGLTVTVKATSSTACDGFDEVNKIRTPFFTPHISRAHGNHVGECVCGWREREKMLHYFTDRQLKIYFVSGSIL